MNEQIKTQLIQIIDTLSLLKQYNVIIDDISKLIRLIQIYLNNQIEIEVIQSDIKFIQEYTDNIINNKILPVRFKKKFIKILIQINKIFDNIIINTIVSDI